MATNKNNDTTALSKVRYDKNNFEGYVTDMKAALRLHPDKLDTVMTKGSLNSLISRRHRDKYEAILDKDGNRKYSDTDIEERLNEIRTEGKAEVAAQILLSITDKSLKQRLERKHPDDGHLMFEVLRKMHTHAGNETRLDTVSDELDDHLRDGLPALTLPLTIPEYTITKRYEKAAHPWLGCAWRTYRAEVGLGRGKPVRDPLGPYRTKRIHMNTQPR